MTLGDAYSSPLVVEALTRSRDGTADPGDERPWKPGVPKPKAPDIARWDAWVRTFLGVQGLLEGLSFEIVPDVDAKKRKAPAETVTLYGLGARSVPVARLTRPAHKVFETQLKQVLDWAELRTERAAEVLAQIDNQYAFWGSIFPFHSGRMRKTVDLVEVVIQFCVFVEARFKHEFGAWRPAELSPQVQPMITTPGHGAFPSGHCTQSYAVAHVLAALLGESLGARSSRMVQMRRLAARIAMNRVVAGVHFPVDNLAGRLLGTCLAEYALTRMGRASSWRPRAFDGGQLQGPEKFLPEGQPLDAGGGTPPPPFYVPLAPAPVPGPELTVDVLAQLWKGAWEECAYLRASAS